jgi:hypothetical protein
MTANPSAELDYDMVPMSRKRAPILAEFGAAR